MLETIKYGLYVTFVGMGGVFAILTTIAFFMWSMGRFGGFGRLRFDSKKQDDEISNELFAIIAATYAYHAEQTGVFPVSGSKGWKKAAKMEVLV